MRRHTIALCLLAGAAALRAPQQTTRRRSVHLNSEPLLSCKGLEAKVVDGVEETRGFWAFAACNGDVTWSSSHEF